MKLTYAWCYLIFSIGGLNRFLGLERGTNWKGLQREFHGTPNHVSSAEAKLEICV